MLRLGDLTSNLQEILQDAIGLAQLVKQHSEGRLAEGAVFHPQCMEVPIGGEHRAHLVPVQEVRV